MNFNFTKEQESLIFNNETMNKKTEFFKSFVYDELYTQQQIGERFGKNRHYVSHVLSELNVKEDDKRGKQKFYYGNTIMELTDKGAFDKWLAEPAPATPKPTVPYQPKNFTLL